MKKIILFFILIALPLITYSQLNGDGSYENPWYGTLDGDATWSGTKYIKGDITVDNEKLTISPGAIIIFIADTANIIITGTGQLEADGTPESNIRFTADDDNDGNYGEEGERWGHISFQDMGSAGPSFIDYCIIEYGDVRTAGTSENPYRYGGAIHAAITNLTVSNCILQNNKAKWGGALFVNKNFSPTIKNCFIRNNSSDHAGGGFYFWDGSASIVENCIFEANACLESSIDYYSGGGLCSQRGTSIKVVNCTFVNNTTTRPTGASIELHVSTNDVVLNCICWGSGTHFYRSGSNIVQYCAVQGIIPTGTGNFQIDADNSAQNGPNFSATDGSDWSLTVNSPCIDKGIDNSSNPYVPLTDFLGNPRFGTTDIGAYEFIFTLFTWQGDDTSNPTLWNDPDNWDSGIVPFGSEDITIPSGLTNYPVGSTSQDYTIGSGKQMIIEPGARVTLNNLTNNGTLKLNHDATDFASLILNGYTRGTGGTEEIQLYLSGGGNPLLEDYQWHYISTPVSSISTGVFTGVTYNLAQFIESRPSTSLMQGWVAFDGYVYSTGQFTGPTFSTLTPGKGYNFFADDNNTFTFGGLFNTSDVVMPLGYSGLPVSGFNLLGNPFSSGLNWDDIIDGVYATYPASTSKGLYFTRDNIQCTYIAGVGVPSDVTGIIPPMQGFFTKTSATGNSITLPASARTHENIHPRYKGGSAIPLVRLAVFEESVSNDETVVRFDEDALTELDNDFDALKMFLTDTKTYIHTTLADVDYAINGQPFPENSIEIPVAVNVISSSVHKISTIQLQGLDYYYISLIDNSTGFTADLRTTPDVTFSAPPGKITDRFILKITNIMSAVEDPVNARNDFNIYSGFNLINIQTLTDDWNGKTGSVKLMDMSGKTVSDLQNTEFNRDVLIQMKAPKSTGLYFVEIVSGVRRYVGKVVIK